MLHFLETAAVSIGAKAASAYIHKETGNKNTESRMENKDLRNKNLRLQNELDNERMYHDPETRIAPEMDEFPALHPSKNRGMAFGSRNRSRR